MGESFTRLGVLVACDHCGSSDVGTDEILCWECKGKGKRPAGHTPGPWKIGYPTSGKSNVPIYGADNEHVAWLDGSAKFGPVWDAAGLANATLIAAGPELLAALQVFTLDTRILAWLNEHDPMALKQAREAIAKALPAA